MIIIGIHQYKTNQNNIRKMHHAILGVGLVSIAQIFNGLAAVIEEKKLKELKIHLL